MKQCKHEDFDASVAVNRLENTGQFIADVRIWCKQCGLPFEFKGYPVGLSFSAPRISFNRQEIRLPIEPHEGIADG